MGIELKLLKWENRYMKYKDTPHSSLVGHMMILHTELKQRGDVAQDNNEMFWYNDAADLVLELLLRYDDYYTKEYFEGRHRLDSER